MIKKFDDFKNKRKNESLKTFTGKKSVEKDEDFNDIDRDRQFPDPTGSEGKSSHKAEMANKQSNIRSTKTPVGDNHQNLNHMDVTKVQAGDHSEDSEGNNDGPVVAEETNERVDFIGKVAKFPKDTQASKALNFLENIKISKKSIWYFIVEKQDNELQMVKYNNKQGLNLKEFVGELKKFYLKKLSDDKAPEKVVEAFNKIEVVGDEEGNFSIVRNIPKVKIDGRPAISILTDDLIKLLGK